MTPHIKEAGAGRPVLILHGGGGPFTMVPIVNHVARSALALAPTHPGWDGTPREASVTNIKDLAANYLQLLEARQLNDVLVIGSSIGGWLAAELALADTARRITGLVLIDAGGIEVPAEPIRDVFSLDARALAEYSFHDGARFFTPPETLPPAQLATRRANLEALRALAGTGMCDPTLLSRLPRIDVPALVLWGESDRIFTPAYGAAYAKALPRGRFELIKQAGHLPHLEQPVATFALLDQVLAPSAAA